MPASLGRIGAYCKPEKPRFGVWWERKNNGEVIGYWIHCLNKEAVEVIGNNIVYFSL